MLVIFFPLLFNLLSVDIVSHPRVSTALYADALICSDGAMSCVVSQLQDPLLSLQIKYFKLRLDITEAKSQSIFSIKEETSAEASGQRQSDCLEDITQVT